MDASPARPVVKRDRILSATPAGDAAEVSGGNPRAEMGISKIATPEAEDLEHTCVGYTGPACRSPAPSCEVSYTATAPAGHAHWRIGPYPGPGGRPPGEGRNGP